MSLNITLFNGLTGLQTNQAALQVTSNNVTNANTEGYTRKIVDQSHVVIGGQGAGVEIAGIRRTVDEYLMKEMRTASSVSSNLAARDAFFQRIQDMFGTLQSNSSLGARISDFASQLQALATNPESASQMLSVVSMGQQVAQQLNQMSQQIQKLRFDADKEIAASIDIINTQLAEIDELNREIARNQVLGLPTGDLEDKRDIAVNKVAEQIDINYFTRSNGEMVIFTQSGRTLLNSDPVPLSHTPVSSMSAGVTHPGLIDGIHVGGVDITTEIRSGRLAALIAMRDETLPNLTAEINTLTTALRDEINRIHNEGSGLPAATTLTSSRPQTGMAVSVSGTIRVTLVNSDGSEAYTAVVSGLAAPDAAGFAAAINAALGGFGGSSATESGGVVTLDGGAYGIVITGGTVDPGGGLPPTSVSDFLHLNDFFVGDDPLGLDTASVLKVRSDIVADPALLSRGTLQLDPVTGTYYLASGDASVVQRLAAKFNERLSFAASGGLLAKSATFAEYGHDILALTSAEYNMVQDRLAYETALAQELATRAASKSGVNIDEEMTNLILYQNAYAASARLITVADELYQILTNMAR